MKNQLLILCLACFMAACQKPQAPKADEETLTIIPEPANMALKPGYFAISNNSTIYWHGEGLEAIAQYFNDRIEPATGFSLTVRKGTGRGINLTLLDIEDKLLGDEGYRLNVTPRNIELAANKGNGIFYGIQTLLQMLPAEIKSNSIKRDVEWKIRSAEILDTPRFKWRGLMLDVSRHFFTKEEVKQYIDQLSEYKMNIFHWHLTDDQGWRIEIQNLPLLTEKGAWRGLQGLGTGGNEHPARKASPLIMGGTIPMMTSGK